METRKEIYKRYFANKDTSEIITISFLRDKEVREEPLTEEESQSLLNFDRFRLAELNKVKNDFDFNARYCELEVMANIIDHREFLKEEYFFSELL
jgi:hypothetical protein